jgi:hypothetical protein
MQQHWTCSTNLIEPFATIDLDSGLVSVEHENQAPDLSQVADNTGDDDWSERMTDDDWSDVGNYFGKFQTLRSKIDFIDFVVGGERRRVFGGASRKFLPETKLRGIVFYAPRNSLMQTVRGGYFDDLLIGNFMKTHLVNMGLYPDFSPRVTKYGDSAGVYSSNQLVRFFWHYFRRSPMAIVRFYANQYWQYYWIPKVKAVLRRLGLFQAMKKLYSQI